MRRLIALAFLIAIGMTASAQGHQRFAQADQVCAEDAQGSILLIAQFQSDHITTVWAHDSQSGYMGMESIFPFSNSLIYDTYPGPSRPGGTITWWWTSYNNKGKKIKGKVTDPYSDTTCPVQP